MPSRKTFLVLLSVLLLPAPLAAQRMERAFPSSADALVELRNQAGRVLVHGWDRPNVLVVYDRRSRSTDVHFDEGANRLLIHTQVLQGDIQASERVVDFEIWMPAAASLDLHLDVGQVELDGLRDGIEVVTVAADVTVRDAVGTIEVMTTSGDVTIADSGGRLKVESVSGSLRFLNTPGRSLTARTASGSIRFEGNLLGGGAYDLSSHEGAIELRLPADASFELTARSVQGQVSNTFPLKLKQHGRLPPPSHAQSLLGTVQSGAALLRASSFSGNISIEKR